MERSESLKQDGLHMLKAPHAIRRFEALPGEGPGTWISYQDHPAYRNFVKSASIANRIQSMFVFGKYLAVILCKRLISYELIPAHLRKPKSAKGVLQLVRKILANITAKVFVRMPGQSKEDAESVNRALREDGICVAKLEPQDFAAITETSRSLFDELRDRRGAALNGGRTFGESRSAATRTAHGDLFVAVDHMLKTRGILDGVSSYLGRKASLVDVNPQINDPSDDFWKHSFPDIAHSERPASYLHRDSSGGDVKAIIYMSDVGPGNGPFSFAVGSHRVRSSRISNWIEETNDQSGLSATDLQSRKLFSALPVSLRKKSTFGNDVLPHTEISQRILSAEWCITAPRGHIVLFDTKGLHRGSMVIENERLVLTCVLG